MEQYSEQAANLALADIRYGFLADEMYPMPKTNCCPMDLKMSHRFPSEGQAQRPEPFALTLAMEADRGLG